MLKKVLLVALLSAYLFGSDFWENSFHQGTSIYNIENSKKEKLSFECGYSGASIYLYNKGNEVNLKKDEPISFIINDEKKLLSTKSVSSSGGTDSDNRAWGNLVSEIPRAKKIIVESNNKEFIFEPSNLKELEYFTKSCLEYENDTSTTPNNTPTNTNSQTNTNSNNPSIDDLITIDLKMEKNSYYGYYYQILVITSLINNLEIQDVKINKEKCQSSISADIFEKNGVLRATDNIYPVTISEYETLKVQTSKDCNIMKIDIFTNKGVISKQKR